jgi:hypothetical protein
MKVHEIIVEAKLGVNEPRPKRANSRPERGHTSEPRYKEKPVEESERSEKFKKFTASLDRITKQAEENKRLQQEKPINRKKKVAKTTDDEQELAEISKPTLNRYLDKSVEKRSKLKASPEASITHPEFEKTSHKIRKSLAGADTAIKKISSNEDFELDEHGKASRKLCTSSKTDKELGASQLSSCKAQGLRKRDTKRKFKTGGESKPKSIKGKLVKASDYGGPLPKWKGN